MFALSAIITLWCEFILSCVAYVQHSQSAAAPYSIATLLPISFCLTSRYCAAESPPPPPPAFATYHCGNTYECVVFPPRRAGRCTRLSENDERVLFAEHNCMSFNLLIE